MPGAGPTCFEQLTVLETEIGTDLPITWQLLFINPGESLVLMMNHSSEESAAHNALL